MVHAYLEESRDLKKSAQLKTSQVDSYRARCAELEALVKNKEAAVADQKRHLKVVKDEYEEKFNVRFLIKYLYDCDTLHYSPIRPWSKNMQRRRRSWLRWTNTF